MAIDVATPTPEVLDALERADVIVVGPSNPVASIGPILALPGMRDAVRRAGAPVIAVSPFVAGDVLKGPTLAFCEHAGIAPNAAGIADAYAGVIDAMVADEPVEGLPARVEDTLMDGHEGRARVARAVLELAASL